MLLCQNGFECSEIFFNTLLSHSTSCYADVKLPKPVWDWDEQFFLAHCWYLPKATLPGCALYIHVVGIQHRTVECVCCLCTMQYYHVHMHDLLIYGQSDKPIDTEPEIRLAVLRGSVLFSKSKAGFSLLWFCYPFWYNFQCTLIWSPVKTRYLPTSELFVYATRVFVCYHSCCAANRLHML